MPLHSIQLQSPIHDSFRVRQVAGMFDLPVRATNEVNFTVELPAQDEPWQIGAIVGPSGSGKTAVARTAFTTSLYTAGEWPAHSAVIDCFGDLPIKQITSTLTSVGLGSPPAWLKPYAILSNGEKFRCDLARALMAEELEHDASTLPKNSLVVFDEFTSFVDRTAARIGSAAVSRAIRSKHITKRFIAVTCHYDVIPWLAPDWVLDMSTGTLTRRRLRRPAIHLKIRRVSRDMWSLFRRHHYLSGSLHNAAQCYAGYVDGRPAAFTAVLPFPHPKRPGWREHRTVCLPDYQGVGIGNALSEFVASLYVATGKPYFSATSHPAMIRHRCNSPLWKMLRRPRLVSAGGANGVGKTGMGATLSTGRLTAGFEYVGKENTKCGMIGKITHSVGTPPP